MFILIFLSIFFKSYGQTFLAVDDYHIVRGKSTSIILKGNASVVLIKSAEIKLKFNSMVVDIKNVIGGENYSIKENSPQFTVNFNDYTNSELIIKSDNFINTDNKICEIMLEGLAGPDSVTTIEPISISINDNIINDTKIVAGSVTVNSSPVIAKLYDGLSNNYPNPFSTNTKFEFTLEKDSKIYFSIFSLNGRKVFDFPSSKDVFSISIFDSKGLIIENPEDKILKQGKYNIDLNANFWELSTGIYYFVFSTESHIFKTNLIYIK